MLKSTERVEPMANKKKSPLVIAKNALKEIAGNRYSGTTADQVVARLRNLADAALKEISAAEKESE